MLIKQGHTYNGPITDTHKLLLHTVVSRPMYISCLGRSEMNCTQSRVVSVTQRDVKWCRLHQASIISFQIKVSLTSGSVLSCPSGQLLPHITATHEIKYNDSCQGNISNIKWKFPEWKNFPCTGIRTHDLQTWYCLAMSRRHCLASFALFGPD